MEFTMTYLKWRGSYHLWCKFDRKDYSIVHTYDRYWTAFMNGRIVLKDKDKQKCMDRIEAWVAARHQDAD
jgi:hypothetical protein